MRRVAIAALIVVGLLVVLGLVRTGMGIYYSDVVNSSITAECIEERSRAYGIGEFADPPIPFGQAIEDEDWVRLYSCYTDTQVESVPDLKAAWPPSYQRCVEDEIGQDAFIVLWLDPVTSKSTEAPHPAFEECQRHFTGW